MPFARIIDGFEAMDRMLRGRRQDAMAQDELYQRLAQIAEGQAIQRDRLGLDERDLGLRTRIFERGETRDAADDAMMRAYVAGLSGGGGARHDNRMGPTLEPPGPVGGGDPLTDPRFITSLPTATAGSILGLLREHNNRLYEGERIGVQRERAAGLEQNRLRRAALDQARLEIQRRNAATYERSVSGKVSSWDDEVAIRRRDAEFARTVYQNFDLFDELVSGVTPEEARAKQETLRFGFEESLRALGEAESKAAQSRQSAPAAGPPDAAANTPLIDRGPGGGGNELDAIEAALDRYLMNHGLR